MYNKVIVKDAGAAMLRARKNKKISQIKLAEIVGLPSSVQVCHYEKGFSSPRKKRAVKIAEVLGVVFEDIFEEVLTAGNRTGKVSFTKKIDFEDPAVKKISHYVINKM